MARPITHIVVFCLALVVMALAAESQPRAQTMTKDDKLYQSWLADRPHISSMEIEGNEFFSASKIRSRLFSRRHTFLQMFRSGSRDRVLRYSINRDTLEVKYMYLRQGYLGIGIEEWFEVAPDSSAVLRMHIREGSRFLVGRVDLEANDSLPFYRELRQTVGRFRTGDPVDIIKVSEVVFDLKTIFANNGYPYAVVEQMIDSAAGPQNTMMVFRTREGELVRFGKLIIDSLSYNAPGTARREIAFKEGELYSREKIIESQKRLYSTNLFNSINLDFYRNTVNGTAGQDLTPDFRFSAIERKPHFISTKTGASQDSLQDLTWDFTFTWGKRNIFTSRRMELSFKYRFVIFTDWRIVLHRYQLRFTEPWFAGFRLPLTLTARFEPGVRSQVQPYRVQTWLLALSTRKEWSEQMFAVISSEFENVNIYGVSSAQAAEIRKEENISMRRKLTLTLVRDTRIDKFVPKQGSFTTYYAQFVGSFLGGDDSFMKLEFSWARYQRAVGQAIYATRIKSGWVKEIGTATEVPINDRFYLGGANSIRGFRENIIGPRIDNPVYQTEDSTSVGANGYLIFNQELRFPAFWKFWGSVFTDIGNGWESFSDIDPDNLLFSYGAGIQFLSPAGPLRLDYAHRLENGIYREDDRWHITILYAF